MYIYIFIPGPSIYGWYLNFRRDPSLDRSNPPGDTIFKAADSNNDGFLSYTEFVAVFQHVEDGKTGGGRGLNVGDSSEVMINGLT